MKIKLRLHVKKETCLAISYFATPHLLSKPPFHTGFCRNQHRLRHRLQRYQNCTPGTRSHAHVAFSHRGFITKCI
uniref:Uncharacterized protein n=1 Tax=Anguilla anguilla TaxID=7936 RepID=A0A0E9PX33_ANGAN